MAKRVLVVDDEPDILKLVVSRVKRCGYEALSAINGEEALRKMRDDKPDLVLLDIMLPDISGGEVCLRAKSDDDIKRIPIIFLSASVGGELSEKAKKYHADDFLGKPFTPEEIKEKLAKFVG